MNIPNKRSSGKAIRVGKPLPTVTLDCSQWQRADGPRSRGKFVGISNHLPGVELKLQCAADVWLELVVSFDANTPPERVMEHANRLIVAASHAAPELGLIYDADHSRTEKENVVIALAPRSPAGTAERLFALAEVIRRATQSVPSQGGVVVRVGGKAA